MGQSPDKVPCDPRVASHAPESWNEGPRAGLGRAAWITQVGGGGLSGFQGHPLFPGAGDSNLGLQHGAPRILRVGAGPK